MCLGYSFCFLAYALQFTVTKDLPTLRQKCWSEVVVSLGFIGVVSVVSTNRIKFSFHPIWSEFLFYFQWKGIWDFSDPLLYSLLGIEDRSLSLLVQAFLSYLVLLFFNNTSLASNRGVVLDCPETVEARQEDLFVLDHFVNWCRQREKPISVLTFSHIGENDPLLEWRATFRNIRYILENVTQTHISTNTQPIIAFHYYGYTVKDELETW